MNPVQREIAGKVRKVAHQRHRVYPAQLYNERDWKPNRKVKGGALGGVLLSLVVGFISGDFSGIDFEASGCTLGGSLGVLAGNYLTRSKRRD